MFLPAVSLIACRVSSEKGAVVQLLRGIKINADGAYFCSVYLFCSAIMQFQSEADLKNNAQFTDQFSPFHILGHI